ncbi:MAG: ATP-binding cassette domain-containing protein [Deltaproteobacteria bacterium]|nr:ATP-binding cassette domain-containing protein [Deltaproteobacteria bacterium]
MSENDLLRVVDYHKHFHISKNFWVKAVDGISFEVRSGEVFSLVGESGSGKSTVAKGVMGIYPANKGQIYFKGHLISDKKSYKKARKHVQKDIQIVFQDSAAALNPRMRVKDIISEPLVVNKIFHSKAELIDRIDELMLQVGLDPLFKTKYPNEISGGQRQRVAIARAIGLNPDLIVADEPVASLDVSIQAQIITLFEYLRKEKNFTFFFIAHDLALVRYISDRVGVMYGGKIVEICPSEELFTKPWHPYTQSLLSAIPVPDPIFEKQKPLIAFDKSKFNAHGTMTKISDDHYALA